MALLRASNNLKTENVLCTKPQIGDLDVISGFISRKALAVCGLFYNGRICLDLGGCSRLTKSFPGYVKNRLLCTAVSCFSVHDLKLFKIQKHKGNF